MPVKHGPPAGDENSPPPDQGRAYQRDARATRYAPARSRTARRKGQRPGRATSHVKVESKIKVKGNVKAKGQNPRLSGVGSPTPAIQSSKPPAAHGTQDPSRPTAATRPAKAARPGARTGHPKPQAKQGNPDSGVRPESGTPARQTGH